MYEQIIFAGFGGQGIQAMSKMLAQAAMDSGRQVSWMPAYGGAVRGGTSNVTVMVADEPIGSPMPNAGDITTGVVMNIPSMLKFESYVEPGGLLLVNSSLIDVDSSRQDIDVIRIPVNDIASEMGNDKVANMIMLGCMLSRKKIVEIDALKRFVKVAFKNKPSIIEINHEAIDRGALYSEQMGGSDV
ncbi:MAG: 2-oxoacid:acceptor oxidoreductase family protein [Synergistaceae bacterium]|jgi:2-oxoglutarate ferredoxin oxidoreductase subunit gamma|nr:2-oxoacid:acceptor oxidoreductase family protein [Synergistaceae bacterium]